MSSETFGLEIPVEYQYATEAEPKTVALKQELAIRYKYDRDAYTEAKGEFLRAYTAKARRCKGEKKRYEKDCRYI